MLLVTRARQNKKFTVRMEMQHIFSRRYIYAQYMDPLKDEPFTNLYLSVETDAKKAHH